MRQETGSRKQENLNTQLWLNISDKALIAYVTKGGVTEEAAGIAGSRLG